MDQTVIDKIKASFARQSYMTTLGAALDHIGKGSVSIRVPMSDHILQQHGFAHAGVAFSLKLLKTSLEHQQFYLKPYCRLHIN